MFKKNSYILSILILLSLSLGACSSMSGVIGTSVTNGGDGTSLPGSAQTAIASVVSNASTSTQRAMSGTPIIASGSNAKTVVGTGSPQPNQTTAATNAGSARTTPGASVNTPNATPAATSIPKTPSAVPGTMQTELDWTAPWTDFLKNIPDGYYTISVDELVIQLTSANPPFLLDVREPSELTQYGYIRGAVNIPYRSVFSNLDKLPALDQHIVVYSGTGHRGTIILSALRLLGYTNAYLLEGGMTAWLKAKQQAEIGTPTAPTSGTAPNVDPKKVSDLLNFIDTGTYGVESSELSGWLGAGPKPIVVDVRERSESSTRGSIKGSVQIPLRTLFDSLNQFSADKTNPIVVFDSDGHRGTIAMMALRMIGYTNVRSLFGGYEAWMAAGLPVVR